MWFWIEREYILELIYDVGLSGAKPAVTYIESTVRLISIDYDHTNGIIGDYMLHDITFYQKLAGKLLYAIITRPDIS